MILWASAWWPMILSGGFRDRKVIDAGDAPTHEAALVELPVLIAVRAMPLAGIVMPFVGEPHCDAILVKCPQFLDQAIVQFLVPFTDQKLHDGVAPGEKLGAVAPNAIGSVSQRDSLRLARIPGVFCNPDFLRSRIGIKGRKRQSRAFKCS